MRLKIIIKLKRYTLIFLALLTTILPKIVVADVVQNIDASLDALEAAVASKPADFEALQQQLKPQLDDYSQQQKIRFWVLNSVYHIYQSDYNSALEILNQAEVLSPTNSTLTSIYLYKATALIGLNAFSQALDVMERNLSRIESLDDVQLKASSYIRLAALFLEMEAWEEIETYANQALRLNNRQNPRNHCYGLLYIAVAKLKKDQLNSAYQQFNDSMNYCHDNNFMMIEAMSLKGIGDVELKRGNVESSIIFLEKALQAYEPFQYQIEINHIHSLLAMAYNRLGKPQQAQYYADLVIAAPSHGINLQYQKDAYKVLAALSQQQGQFESAYNYLNRYQEISENLHNETKAKAYAYQLAKFDNVEKTREIKMLNQDRALYTAQQKVMELQRYKESMALLVALGCSVFFIIFGATMFLQKRKYKRVSELDQLTGIFNRGTGQDLAENLFIDVIARQGKFSVVMFDLDNFKAINDTLGHGTGDWALKHVAQVVRPLLKSRDLFVRMGGEEFALFLPDADADVALNMAEQCRAAIEAINTKPHYSDLVITASFGVTTNIDTDLSLDPMMKRADIAMYQAKLQGRNCVVEYQETMSMIAAIA